MDKMSILPILQKIPLFANLSDEDNRKVIDSIMLNFYPAGYTILREGQEGNEMHIIRSGKVEVSRGGQVVNTLGNNEFYGEMALIEDKPRNATIKTLEDSEIFVLKKEDFYNLVRGDESVAKSINQEFLARLMTNE